ncbi:hypothetical protein M5D96_005388 [Drosophila gunungcola]|uniref:Uncharacterized protein n=1 Tax=Drosophila gunungcola TaxID=103775 RepID=A0A9Q0BR49_9MUSC|nr:hypothetical protein M5D96_005388 [Drosophila gunungcola]
MAISTAFAAPSKLVRVEWLCHKYSSIPNQWKMGSKLKPIPLVARMQWQNRLMIMDGIPR